MKQVNNWWSCFPLLPNDHEPADDLNELWRRIVFTILVSNKDDHLKNHGFIYVGGDRWRLSPAFDITPSPSRHRVLETGFA